MPVSDKIRLNMIAYYHNNKDKINAKKYIKVNCEYCGSLIVKSVISRHKGTKKCKKLREQAKEEEQQKEEQENTHDE